MKNWLASHSLCLQRWTLRILDWAWRSVLIVVFTSLAGVAAFLLWRVATGRNPDGATVTSLAVITIVSLILAFWGRDLVRRVRKIGSAGVEFHVWEEIEQIPELRDAPKPPESPRKGDKELSPEQAWHYELLSSLWFHLHHLGVDATELSGLNLRRYRDMVLWLGKTALFQRGVHISKALEVLRSIENLENLDGDESYYLAMAYLLVAVDEKAQNADSSRVKFRRSAVLLKRVVKEDAAAAASHYALGYAYDELGHYDLAIKHEQQAVELNQSEYGTFGRWIEAVSLLKQEKPAKALAVLRRIPESGCRGKIREAVSLAKKGKPAEALAILRQIPESEHRGEMGEAVSLARQEKTAEALAVLQNIPEGGDWDKIWNDDELASLRDDPKFKIFFWELWAEKSGRGRFKVSENEA